MKDNKYFTVIFVGTCFTYSLFYCFYSTLAHLAVGELLPENVFHVFPISYKLLLILQICWAASVIITFPIYNLAIVDIMKRIKWVKKSLGGRKANLKGTIARGT